MKDFIRPFIQVIALAEEGWNIQPEHKQYIDKILTVYYFNQNSHTHLCEFTPSYELHHHEYQVRMNEAGEALRETNQHLYDEIRDNYEQIYVEERVTYMHVSTVDKFIKWVADEKLEFRHYEYGDIDEKLNDADLAELLEDEDWTDIVNEYLNCNGVV